MRAGGKFALPPYHILKIASTISSISAPFRIASPAKNCFPLNIRQQKANLANKNGFPSKEMAGELNPLKPSLLFYQT